MVFIVISHYSVHGQLQPNEMGFGINRLILSMTNVGHLGVDIFILISGYFMINSKYNLKKFLKLISQVEFYSITIYLVLVLLNHEDFSLKALIRTIFPTIFIQYWFFTAYIVLYLLHPFLNVLLKKIDKRTYYVYLFILLVLWSIIPTITSYNLYGSEIPQFVLLYSLGAFIRLHFSNERLQKQVGVTLSISIPIILIISITALTLISIRIGFFERYINIFYQRNSIFIILLSLGLFIVFKNLNMKHNKFVNGLAKCAFGVYLIHDNVYMRSLLWKDLFGNAKYENSPKLIIHMAFCVLIVYIVCTIIEFLRINLLEKPLFKLVNKPIEKLEVIIRKIINLSYNKLIKKI